MDFTGERFVPQVNGNIELEHMHRYFMACELAVGKDVLDIACGEGYGSARLSNVAREVYGVDISSEAVAHANTKYIKKNLRFSVGSCDAIPLPDQSVDLVVSFETIEHHDKHEEMMLEIRRVLRPGGVVIISSPDKQVYSIEPNYQNPYHVKELFADEFIELLSKHFKKTKFFGQKISYGSVILESGGSSPQKSYWDHNDQVQSLNGSHKPVYLLCIASDSELPSIHAGIYDRPEKDSGYACYLNSIIAERDKELATLRQGVADRDAQIRDLESIIESAKRWQERSWAKRAFHRCRAPNVNRNKTNKFKKLERSIRKLRKQLLPRYSVISKNKEGVSDTQMLTQKTLINLVAFDQSGKPRGWVRFLIFHKNRTPRRIFRQISCRKSGVPRPAFIAWMNHKSESEFTAILGEVPPACIPKEQINSDEPIVTDIRAIAIYLPQFHSIPENDDWWGKGFTEWTNVRRAMPQYEGHYQPHVPHPELGYYDLNDPTVMEKQIAMARAAGIEGFCYYYYWFNGRRLLNMPTDRMLANEKPDFPFCFCWANENWTRTWDGGNKKILIEQEYSFESDERFILDLLPAFRDKRYIRVDGKPLLIIYRPGLLPDPAASALHWRETCRREGIGEIFIARMQMFDWELEGSDPGYDTVIQFPPVSKNYSPDFKLNKNLDVNNTFSGKIHDYRLSAASYPLENIGKNLWPGVSPSWDNTARRMERGTSWINSSPENYYYWLKSAIKCARNTLPSQERFLFINAWNEWAEGCHLEPDEKYGYAWLNATRLALTDTKLPEPPPRHRVLVVGHDAARAGAQIVLLNMLQEWQRLNTWDFQLLLLGDGVLRGEYEKVCATLVITDYKTKLLEEQALNQFCNPAPDVILANTVVAGPFLLMLAHYGVPIITYVHELQKSIERWASGPIMEATIENSDHFIAVSDPVKQNLIQNHGIPSAEISCINAYIKTSYSTPKDLVSSLREELGLNFEEKVIFGCGTIDWRKGPDLFVQVALEVLKKIPEVRFIWIGSDSGDEASSLAHVLATDSRIRFIGERENPRDYFALGHAFFLSSREDPFPLVALEAADAALPVVCFANAGGMPEFVGNTCGRTVAYENIYEAADAFVQILMDDKMLESLGSNGRTSVRMNHDSAKGSEAVLQVLERHYLESESKEILNIQGGKEPLISVIVPNYNHARFLPERLSSIMRQTYTKLEIILLDDCSTDESLNLLQEFIASEPRARLITNEENSGSTFIQWRKGITEAKGKYIWIAESDDSANPELLARLVHYLESDSEISLACCQLRMMDPEGKIGGTPDGWLGELDSNRWGKSFINDGIDEIRSYLSKKNTILNASGVVFRRFEGIELLADPTMRLCADWLFWSRLLSRGKIAYHSEPLNYWRLQSSNARTRPTGELEWEEGQRVIEEIAKIINASPIEKKELLTSYRKKCNDWYKKNKTKH
jgi:glycosyltransferase involved in cell wall biosynthesis/ubiquinone/menaquinone biosynthesis C-methylase UbiE